MKTSNEKLPGWPAEIRLDNDALLVVFIHGFRSMANTFGLFPELLENMLLNEAGISTTTVSYPTYKTKGEMDTILSQFAQWLTDVISERREQTGMRHTKVVLCAHSLGGFLAADLLRRQYMSASPVPLDSKIVACIAYDTPYLGMNGSIFKNVALSSAQGSNSTSATSSISQQPDQSSIPCSNIKWARIGTYTLGCSILAGSAAFAVIVESMTIGVTVAVGSAALLVSPRARHDFSRGFKWTTDYCKYLRDSLFNQDMMKKRVQDLVKIEQDDGAVFRVLYASLPQGNSSRTFITLPEPASPAAQHFLPAINNLASNEIMAHTGMFCSSTNDGYNELGRLTATLIRDAIVNSG